MDDHKSVVRVGAALHDRRGASRGILEETVLRETNKRKIPLTRGERGRSRHRSSWSHVEVGGWEWTRASGAEWSAKGERSSSCDIGWRPD